MDRQTDGWMEGQINRESLNIAGLGEAGETTGLLPPTVKLGVSTSALPTTTTQRCQTYRVPRETECVYAFVLPRGSKHNSTSEGGLK